MPQASALHQQERTVESHSAALRKELGLTDLTLTQVLFIVGLPWVGVAAKQGPAHIVLWLASITFFYLPSAAVVIHLNRAMPLEGGLYQWAKLGFNELTGFLVAWNLWLFAILNTSEIGLQLTQYVRYIVGAGGEWLTGSAWFVAATNAVVLTALTIVTVRGLGVGKWVHKAGGLLMLTTFAMLMLLPWLNVAHGSLAEFHPLQAAVPVMSLLTHRWRAFAASAGVGGRSCDVRVADDLVSSFCQSCRSCRCRAVECSR